MSKKNSSILVISDCYPPEIRGGAELSLQQFLENADSTNWKIVVAALSQHHSKPITEQIGPVTVYRIPWFPCWLPSVSFDSMRDISQPSPMFHRIVRVFRYLFKSGTSGKCVRLVNLISGYYIVRKLGLNALPTLDRESVELSAALVYLRELVAKLQPAIIHADNFRSILFSSCLANQGCPMVAFVRDNRFFCMEPAQKMNINGSACCTSCKFECVNETSGFVHYCLDRFMAENRKYRLEALNSSILIGATSEYLKSSLSALTPNKQIWIVSNSHDPLDMVDTYQKNISKSSPPEVLFVGTLCEAKNPMLLAICFATIKKNYPDVRLVYAGTGNADILGEIKLMAHNFGLENSIDFTGFLNRKELYRRYARSSVVVAPVAWPEPFGRVPLEAGISRRPVIASDLGGYRESIVHEVTGLLIKPNDESSLTQAITRILENPSWASQLGEQARAYIKDKFAISRTTNGMMALWEKALGLN